MRKEAALAAALRRQAASKRFARWWTVRSAGGLYQVLKRWPEALPRLSLAQLTEMAGPLASKAALRLPVGEPSGCSKTEPKWCCASRPSVASNT